VGRAVREADGLQGDREVRGQLERHVQPDDLRRRRPVRHGLGLGRREPPADLRRRGAGGQRQPRTGHQGLLQGVPVAGEQHGRRQALRRLAPVGAERADVQHEVGPEEADELERDLFAPIQIADAALYLSKTKPALGIKDPYELTKAQLDAAVALLKSQRPLVKKYWGLASDQIDLFKNGGSTIGASWPYQVNTLKAAKVPVASSIPKEGVTGWLDTWMLSSKAKHPNCAYLWMQYISTPKPQAQQAIYFGETPVNKKACKIMDSLSKGSCAQYSANAPESFYRSIKFWKTPIADCGNGKKNCMDLRAWTTAWTQVKG